MIAFNIPPNHDRAQFGFECWKDFDADLWKRTCDEATAKIKLYNGALDCRFCDTNCMQVVGGGNYRKPSSLWLREETS